MSEMSREQRNDIRVLLKFTEVYCTSRHAVDKGSFPLPEGLERYFRKGILLCPSCADFVAYALQKREKCPLDPKPSCKHCKIHCYSREYRDMVRTIMAFSGRKLIMRGRLDYLWHYFF